VKPVPIPVTPVKTSAKQPQPLEIEDGVLDLAPTPKKPQKQLKRKFADGYSPSKRRRLEEDGLVEMDGPNERLDDRPGNGAPPDSDIIVIDVDD
jgi:ubiquitin-like 1-activating enzyme E1 B